MRAIGVLTTSRADYGIYVPILRRVLADPELRLMLFVGGAHLAPEFGLTVREIINDGFPIAETVESLLASDTPEGIVKSMGLSLIGLSQAFTRSRPDILMVLGDRYEMFAAAAASVPFRLPLAHVHGGETSQGALDECFRHATTKLAHLHFASTDAYADRIVRMGEAPWRVLVSGAPALDDIDALPEADPAAFEQRHGVPVSPPPLLVTYHPVTLERDQLEDQVDALFGALDDAAMPVIMTDPNADEGGAIIRRKLAAFQATRPHVSRVTNLGRVGYFHAMQLCAAMVGNSSSGIIEAASFELPVVNIGTRQHGRIRGANVIDAACDRAAIAAAIRRATSPAFRSSIVGMSNPYFHGGAAARIVDRLKSVPLGDRLLRKEFHDGDLRSTR